MDLRERLKKETKSLHDKIEQTYLLKKILQHEITFNDYKCLIKKFYAFITPCEDLINSLECRSIIENRKKIPWLEEDLHLLKMDNKFPKCIDLPVLSEHEDVLGYLYVMEGATLGGQIISKMLKTQLQITQDNGGRYFNGYGDGTEKMWNEFCSCLSSIKDIQQQNKIILSASNTFNQLYKWMMQK